MTEDIVHQLNVLATDREADDVVPDVAIAAADEIKVLRHVVRLLAGDRADPIARLWMKHSPADEAYHRALGPEHGSREVDCG